jgi:hypothetical protein
VEDYGAGFRITSLVLKECSPNEESYERIGIAKSTVGLNSQMILSENDKFRQNDLGGVFKRGKVKIV